MLDQMDLKNMYRASHPRTSDYTFFSSAHGTFSRIDHMLEHKFKTEITPSIFSLTTML